MFWLGLIIGLFAGLNAGVLITALCVASAGADMDQLEEKMFQKIFIIGRLGKDPEMRFTPAGQPVTSFSVATDRSWTQDGEEKKETTWWRVSVWGKLAESCNTYLKKGKLVAVEGRLVVDPKTGGPRLWTDQDNLVHASFEIQASVVKFLSPREEAAPEATAEIESGPAEEIPF